MTYINEYSYKWRMRGHLIKMLILPIRVRNHKNIWRCVSVVSLKEEGSSRLWKLIKWNFGSEWRRKRWKKRVFIAHLITSVIFFLLKFKYHAKNSQIRHKRFYKHLCAVQLLKEVFKKEVIFLTFYGGQWVHFITHFSLSRNDFWAILEYTKFYV